MRMDTVVVNFDEHYKKQICFVINNLSNYKVTEDYNFLDEVKHLNKDSLLIVSLNTEAYATDYLSIHEIINNHPGVMVVVLATAASKDIISKAYTAQCAAIVDKQYFHLFAEFILESITTFKGFYVSPLFVKYLIEESPNKIACSNVFLSKSHNDIVYCLTQGYSYIEIANALNLSINTVKKYIKVIYTKLNITSKYELVELLYNGSIKINPKVVEPVKSHIKFINVTEKEQTILTLLNKKKTVKEIASELSITQLATKYYIKKLKQKKLVD